MCNIYVTFLSVKVYFEKNSKKRRILTKNKPEIIHLSIKLSKINNTKTKTIFCTIIIFQSKNISIIVKKELINTIVNNILNKALLI